MELPTIVPEAFTPESLGKFVLSIVQEAINDGRIDISGHR